MLLGMRFPAAGTSIQFGQTGVLSSYSSLYNVIAPGAMQQVQLLTRAQWEGLFPGVGSLQPYCNMNGFNLVPNCNYNGCAPLLTTESMVRIGYLPNEQNDCGSPDSYVGYDPMYIAFEP